MIEHPGEPDINHLDDDDAEAIEQMEGLEADTNEIDEEDEVPLSDADELGDS